MTIQNHMTATLLDTAPDRAGRRAFASGVAPYASVVHAGVGFGLDEHEPGVQTGRSQDQRHPTARLVQFSMATRTFRTDVPRFQW